MVEPVVPASSRPVEGTYGLPDAPVMPVSSDTRGNGNPFFGGDNTSSNSPVEHKPPIFGFGSAPSSSPPQAINNNLQAKKAFGYKCFFLIS